MDIVHGVHEWERFVPYLSGGKKKMALKCKKEGRRRKKVRSVPCGPEKDDKGQG